MAHLILSGNYDLSDPAQRDAAFAEARKVERFEKCSYINDTQYFRVNIALYQGIQHRGDVPDGYVQKTGVIVLTTNLNPGGEDTSYVDSSINCLATKVTCSIEWYNRVTTEVGTFDHRDVIADVGSYIKSATFGISDNKQWSATDLQFTPMELAHQNEFPSS